MISEKLDAAVKAGIIEHYWFNLNYDDSLTIIEKGRTQTISYELFQAMTGESPKDPYPWLKIKREKQV